MAAIRPGNNDRAWNDPPMFAYESSFPTQGTPVKRSVLSGRIRHPLPAPSPAPLGKLLSDSTPSPEAPSADEMLHSTGRITEAPPTCPVPQVPAAAVTTTLMSDTHDQDTQDEPTPDPDVLRAETIQYLEQVLQSCQDNLGDRVVADVRRRLVLLSSSWSGGKLSPAVQIKMRELALALTARDVEIANSLHLSLMVDYVSEVSQWMVGIKHLIQEVWRTSKKETETPSVDN